jgi:transposase
MPMTVGLDWGASGHAVCALDEHGTILVRFECPHSAAGLAELLRRLSQIAAPEALPVAIERPSGLVVETLAAAGHPIVPIHPNVVKACRPRYRAAGGKSDPGDAYMLADILRTDGHRFQPLTAVSGEIKALRALVRGRDDLVAQRVALTNQLRAVLDSFWPGVATIFAALDSPIALAFIARYPTPESAHRLGEKRMASFLRQQGYPGRRTPAVLLERLRAAPVGQAPATETEAKGRLVRALVSVLETLAIEIGRLSSRIEQAVAELPDGRIIMSFPRAGRINAAQMLAEIGDQRARFQTFDQLAAEAGVSPVTHASGKRRGVVFRFACNHRLRAAITCFADNSRHASPWAAQHYAQARSRGCTHSHAVRVLARAWLRVLWRAWLDERAYDPQRHSSAARLTA